MGSSAPNSPRIREGSHSRKLVVASPATNITFYSAQSCVTLGSCCLLPGYSHTCCKDLLRGATGCCSRVAGELVLYSLVRTARSMATQEYRYRGAGVALSGRSQKTRFP